MADDATFFRARAAVEHAAAEAATLDNVRSRCERAEAAWTQMAIRAERIREQRKAREADSIAINPENSWGRAALHPEDDGS